LLDGLPSVLSYTSPASMHDPTRSPMEARV
jgi:hypothetical protein